ncbi:AMP-binding protein [Sphingomonas sp. MMS24-JH45]
MGADAGRQRERRALVMFTSGSTARPKGAMMTHGNYLAKFAEMRLLDGRLGSATRSLMPLGLHSSPGTPWGIFFTTTLGGTLYATRKYEAARVLRTLAGERIDFFLGVPMIYDQIAREPGFADADLSALTFARVGGATPTPEMLAAWRAKGVVVRQL